MQIKSAINLVTGVQNGGFVTVEKTGDAKMKKTGNPLRDAKVEKFSKFQIQVGCDMQNIENARAAREGRPAKHIGPLPWGEYLGGGLPIIKHKDKMYIRGFWVKGIETTYTVDGKPATDEQVAIIKKFSNGGGLSKSAPITIGIDSITRMAGGGKVAQ